MEKIISRFIQEKKCVSFIMPCKPLLSNYHWVYKMHDVCTKYTKIIVIVVV